ncbi:DUF2550 domain-containing protein [Desertihabitans aurantiacus]|uniref:DUF2550 domain-containing protein n=1 Tax=Desertihabitans aurantiacus TaxID=2282477 RepID=UPI0018E54480|nr:DUF2550 domain-containing protein [Desertihabitans aurantiacus]
MEWLPVVEIVFGLLALAVLPLLLMGLRRRWLSRAGSMFECSMRIQTTTPGAGWALGVARYEGENLDWFRVFSLSLRPRVRIPREGTALVRRRPPEGSEAVVLYSDQQVVQVSRRGQEQLELAMNSESVTGFLSWLEAAPPRDDYPT